MSRTKQEVLNIVVPHAKLIVEKPSRWACVFQVDKFVNDTGSNDFLPCFIGALIPNELELQGFPTTIDKLIYDNPNIKEFLCEDIDFLWDLQRMHDLTRIVEWMPSLQALAEKNGLEFPQI